MIDASATAIGRGPIAVNGSKNSGSRDDVGAQDQGFGDYLEEASSGSAGGGDVGAAATEPGDGKLARSIVSLFAIVDAGAKLTQQSASAGADLLANQAGAAADTNLPTGADETALSLLGRALDLDADGLAALLSGPDGAGAAEKLAAILAELQQSGQMVAPSEDIETPSLPDDDAALDAMLADMADAEATETGGVVHRLLSALSKALKEEGDEDASIDETLADAGEDATSSTTLLNPGQGATAAVVAKTADIVDPTPTRGGDSVKDALAQISSQPHQDKAVHADVTAEETAKSGRTGDELSFDGFDQLTVLDSRRYLGFGGDNAKLLTTALAGEANRALAPYATLTDVSTQATATTVNTLKIQMNPEHLGTMTASLRLKGEELSVEVTVDTIEGYRHLAKDHSAIVQSLRDQGFSVDQVSIQLNPAPKTESQQQDQGQNGSNQNLREGQGDAQRQQSGDGRPAPRSERLAIGDLQPSELDDGRGSGASGDGLYL